MWRTDLRSLAPLLMLRSLSLRPLHAVPPLSIR
jgi:hypothetical protein